MQKQYLYISILLILCTFRHVPVLAKDDNFRWFKEEIECDAYKLKIRSYCYDEGIEYQRRNHFCPQQLIFIQHPSGKTYKKQLTFKKYWQNKLAARALMCAKNEVGKIYFLVSFANGGNCEFCEAYELMNDKGKWLTRHGKNLSSIAQREGITLSPWPGGSFTYFSNTIVDEDDQK